MVKSKKRRTSRIVGRGLEEQELTSSARGNVKCTTTGAVCQVLNLLGVYFPYDLHILLLDIYSREKEIYMLTH